MQGLKNLRNLRKIDYAVLGFLVLIVYAFGFSDLTDNQKVAVLGGIWLASTVCLVVMKKFKRVNNPGEAK